MKLKLLAIAIFIVSFGMLSACQKNAQQTLSEHGQMDDAPRISLADAKKDFDAGTAIFIDTRGEASFKQEHVKGAINIMPEQVEFKYKEIPTGKKLIVYCS